MRLLWLADALRGAGLTVHEVDGWKTRGSDSYGPVYGVTIHETRGSATSTDAGEIRVLLEGSTTANPPIAQLYLSRTGHWHVVASGTCFHNKTGWAGPNQGLGNDSLLGIEAQHSESEDWTAKPVQYQSYVRGVAALVARGGWPVHRIGGHKEHQPGEKTDPEFSMNRFRSDVAAVLSGDEMSEWSQPDPYGKDPDGYDARTPGMQLRDLYAAVFFGVRPVDGQGNPLGQEPWITQRMKSLESKVDALTKPPAATVDIAALVAALRPELDAAAERAVRKVLGTLDNPVQ